MQGYIFYNKKLWHIMLCISKLRKNLMAKDSKQTKCSIRVNFHKVYTFLTFLVNFTST
uniref:Uncharacterized protein n=1 Tax=Rhizophora mucronata TaxID=61149 RepID=A0A2P2P757_RHIMU